MIDDIKDLFKPITQRLATPLFSSFILSWILTNWRIFIGLFTFKKEDLIAGKYSSFIDFIEKQTSSSFSFWFPVACAVIYTFAYPFLRICISALYEYIKKISSRWNFGISKEGRVSVTQYLKHVQNYNQLQKHLQDILDQESTFRELNESLTETNIGQKLQINTLQKEISGLKTDNKVQLLQGEWLFIDNLDVANRKARTIVFKDNELIAVDHNRNKHATHKLVNFISNPQMPEFALILEPNKNAGGNKITQILKFSDDFKTIDGTENNNFRVRYVRAQPIESGALPI